MLVVSLVRSRRRMAGSLGGGFPESSASFKLHMPKVALLRKSSNRSISIAIYTTTGHGATLQPLRAT